MPWKCRMQNGCVIVGQMLQIQSVAYLARAIMPCPPRRKKKIFGSIFMYFWLWFSRFLASQVLLNLTVTIRQCNACSLPTLSAPVNLSPNWWRWCLVCAKHTVPRTAPAAVGPLLLLLLALHQLGDKFIPSQNKFLATPLPPTKKRKQIQLSIFSSIHWREVPPQLGYSRLPQHYSRCQRRQIIEAGWRVNAKKVHQNTPFLL